MQIQRQDLWAAQRSTRLVLCHLPSALCPVLAMTGFLRPPHIYTPCDDITHSASGTRHPIRRAEACHAGSNDNFSWNCGAEGECEDADILWRRERQMRNLMVALMVSQGTPMVLSGEPAAGVLI